MVSPLCACVHGASNCSIAQTFAHIPDNCRRVVSHLCAFAHGFSGSSILRTFARIQDNCRCMVSHVCACAHEVSTFSFSQTFAGIQDNCTCMVPPLSAVVHGQLPCFLASLRPSLVIRTKKILRNNANLEPRIVTVTVYEYYKPS